MTRFLILFQCVIPRAISALTLVLLYQLQNFWFSSLAELPCWSVLYPISSFIHLLHKCILRAMYVLGNMLSMCTTVNKKQALTLNGQTCVLCKMFFWCCSDPPVFFYFEINVREGITPLVSCMVSMFPLIQKFRNRERQRGKTTLNSNYFLFPQQRSFKKA